MASGNGKDPLGILSAPAHGSDPLGLLTQKKSSDFSHGYQPTPQDIATKKSFDDLEHGFDASTGGLSSSPGFRTPDLSKKEVGVDLSPFSLRSGSWDAPVSKEKVVKTKPRLPTKEEEKVFDKPVNIQTGRLAEETPHANSWANLGTFVPDTVVGGLQKDASDLVKYMMKDPSKHPEYTANNNILLDISQKLDAASKEHLEKAQQYQLPNTTGGNVVSTATSFLPDLIELAGTPEAKIAEIGKLGEMLTKYGGKYAPKVANMAGGKFPLLMGAKGLTSGYVEGIDAGMTPYEANKHSLQKMAGEYGKGLLYEGAGNAAEKASDIGKKFLEEKGWMADGKVVAGAQKAILNSTAQATAFSAVPFVTNALHGNGTSLDEFKNNFIFGGILGAFHGDKKAEDSPADGSAAEVQNRSPLIDIHNFMNADMDAVKFAHGLDATPTDLQMKAAVHADNAFKSDDPTEKQEQVVQSSLHGKLASVKAVTNAILGNKEALIRSLDDIGLPEGDKQTIINKINDVHKQFDPIEQQKTALSDKIQALTDAPADGIIAEKEKAVRLKDLNKQLDEVVANQYDQQKDRASGKNITYKKGIGEDEGKFFKTVDGKPEEITQSRYELEKPVTDNSPLKTTENEQNDEAQKGNKESPEASKESVAAEEKVNISPVSDIEHTIPGEKMPVGLSHQEADKWFIDHETDPNEIAARYHKEQGFADDKEKAIIDYLGNSKINEQDYNRFGDRNRLDAAKRLRWIDSTNSDSTGLDVHAEALSHELGYEVTPQDFIDVIDKYKGREHFNEENKSDTQKLLEQKYEELTGKKLTPKRAETAFNSKLNLTPAEHTEANDLLAEHGLTTKDLEDDEQERNQSSETTSPAATDAKSIQQPENDGTGDAGKTGQGEAQKSEATPLHEDETSAPGEVKKTILTKRAYEGAISDDVKTHLEEKGLTRKSFTQEERSKQATDFINKFGDDAALLAVETGDVDGGLAASILAQLQIKNSRAMAEFPEGSEERDALAKKQADIIALMEKKGYLGGEFNGQLAHEYQNAELDYANVKKQVEQSTGKPLTEAQEKKIKTVTAENEQLKKQLQESEAKLIEETDKAFKAGEEAVKNETRAEKAKRVASKLRSLKISSINDATLGIPIAIYNGALETSASLVEGGGKLADAIDAGIEHIKNTDWYKGLSSTKQKQVETDFKKLGHGSSGSTDLADLQGRFADKKDNKFTTDEARDIWGYMKKTYIENGTSFKDALSKTAQDLGLSWRQISEAVTTPKLKRVSDEMWKRQADLAQNRTTIKNWIGDQNKSLAWKALQKVSGLFRGTAVFGHGGIFVGTHAGMTLFNPSMWNKTIPAFFRGWKLAYGNEANYERQMEELKNSPNYLIAQRAGLKNNPERLNAEEYQKSQKYLGKLGLAGERGFNAIKVLRQDLFDHHFNRLSPAERDDPAVAKSIAHLVNLATGATNANIPAWVNEVSFAGGMEASRWEKLTASPAKATRTALKAIFTPDKATAPEKVFAKIWARRVGEQLATLTGALLANAAIQNQLNPKNPVNLSNPNKPDFLKFKIDDVTLDPTSGMRSTAMFIYTLGKVPFESKKETHGEKRVEVAGKEIAGYARGKLAPLYGTVADFFGSQDFSGNIMPYSDDSPGTGKHKLSWTEYGLSKMPLPVAEAVGVTYQSAIDNGAHKSTLNAVLKGMMSGVISGTTGIRVGEYGEQEPKLTDIPGWNEKIGGNTPDPDKETNFIKLQYPAKSADGTMLEAGVRLQLSDKQVKERQKINEDFIKQHGTALTKRFTTEAKGSKSVREKLKKLETYWKEHNIPAEKQAKYKQMLIDNFVKTHIKEQAEKHSKPIILRKYKKADGSYAIGVNED